MNIDILGDRFLGMFKEQTETGFVLRLEIDFRSKVKGLKWNVFNKSNGDEDIIIVVPKKEVRNEIYHVLGMESMITFDDLIEHSKHIIDFNMEIENKKILLKEKMEELSDLFVKHTIEELHTMKFVFGEPEIAESFKPILPKFPKSSYLNKKEKRSRNKKVMETATETEEIVNVEVEDNDIKIE
jgi:hypothetical protein